MAPDRGYPSVFVGERRASRHTALVTFIFDNLETVPNHLGTPSIHILVSIPLWFFLFGILNQEHSDKRPYIYLTS